MNTSLLTKDQASGKFKLTIGAMKSADLSTYSPLSFLKGETTVNSRGEMEFTFSSPGNAAFFRLKTN